jgi:hypothetical protein
MELSKKIINPRLTGLQIGITASTKETKGQEGYKVN